MKIVERHEYSGHNKLYWWVVIQLYTEILASKSFHMFKLIRSISCLGVCILASWLALHCNIGKI